MAVSWEQGLLCSSAVNAGLVPGCPHTVLRQGSPSQAKLSHAEQACSHTRIVSRGRRQQGFPKNNAVCDVTREYCAAVHPRGAEQRSPGSVWLQSRIGARGVTSVLCYSSCSHTDLHQALGSIRHGKKKSSGLSGSVACLPLQKEICRYCQCSWQTCWIWTYWYELYEHCTVHTHGKSPRFLLTAFIWIVFNSVPAILSAKTHRNPKQI